MTSIQWTLTVSLVHNNAASNNIEKFQYLRSYLISDAASVVCNYQLTVDLYPLVYQTSQDRYSNERRFAQLYINKVLDFTRNSNTLTSFSKILKCVHTIAINSFKVLNI